MEDDVVWAGVMRCVFFEYPYVPFIVQKKWVTSKGEDLLGLFTRKPVS